MPTLTTRILFVLFLLLPALVKAQRALPMIPESASINQFEHGPSPFRYHDLTVVGDEIWIGGRADDYNDINACLWSWDGAEYTVVDCPFTSDIPSTSIVYKIIVQGDEVYLSGRFNDSGEVLRFANGEWEDLGANTDRGVTDMLFIDGVLHVVGDYGEFNGVEGNYVYTFENGEWNSMGSPSDDEMSSIAYFNDQIYVGGQFEVMGNAMYNIAVFENGDWQGIGGGVDDEVTDLQVYQDQLFMFGDFDEAIDGGLQLPHIATISNGTFNQFTDIEGLIPNTPTAEVVDGKMYIGSSWFSTLGTAVIDGDEIGEYSPFIISAITSFEDELYFTGEDLETVWNIYETTLYRIDPDHQTTVDLENEVIAAGINCTPSFFAGAANFADYKVLQDQGQLFTDDQATIYASSLWYGGLHEETLYIGETTYFGDDDEPEMRVSYGPISTSYDREYVERYYSVWHITREEIEHHQEHYLDELYDPVPSILTYPGNGRVEHGESTHLLPFADVNGNGWYDPLQGDYPLIRGDQSVFLIHSDQRFELADQSPGFEIITELYSFDEGGQDVLNTVFTHVEFRNASDRDYEDFIISVWADFDIGSPNDDWVGSSPEGNYFYAFNGDAVDEASSASAGFSEDIPAQAVAFLQDDLYTAFYYNSSGNPLTGEPNIASDHYNYMNAQWKNGQEIYFGGDGLNEIIGADPDTTADHFFPDFPWESGEGVWNEVVSGNPPGDRRILGSIPPFDFDSGDTFCFDYAYVTAFPNSDEEWSEVMVLDERVGSVGEWFSQQSFNCEWEQNPLNVEADEIEFMAIEVYPNPTSGQLTIASAEGLNNAFTLFDLSGRVVLKGQLVNGQSVIDVSGLRDGVYVLTLSEMQVAKRVVIQK